MKKAFTIFAASGMVMLLSGCPIWIETDDVDPIPTDPCPDGCIDTCFCDDDCSPGYFCEGGVCEPTWFCSWDGTCNDGFICDDRNTCVPDPGIVEPVPCDEDADCLEGYCGDDGLCIDTGACELDEDCSAFGAGLICDDRGVCIPDPGPCPDGECGCSNDDECTDGNLCINSRCTDVATICIFDFECGDSGVCINNGCNLSCETDGEICPIGQGCSEGACRDLEVGIDGCTFDEDCGTEGDRCINSTCHPACSDVEGEGCGDGEVCRAGVCRADSSPTRECTVDGGECDEGMLCARGKCRLPCVASLNCTVGDMTVCGPEEYCLFPEEVQPACMSVSDCELGSDCQNGSCTTIEPEL